MPDNFEIANKFTTAAEGGLTDDPNDRGGITNHGVSLAFLRDLAEESQANRETLHRMQIRLPITRDVIKTLTPDQATSLFRRQFWNRLHLDDGMPCMKWKKTLLTCLTVIFCAAFAGGLPERKSRC